MRQNLGWREFVRGIYWAEVLGYAQTNHMNATRDLPALYWTGQRVRKFVIEAGIHEPAAELAEGPGRAAPGLP